MKTKITKLLLGIFLVVAPVFTVLADDPGAPPDPGNDPTVDPNAQPVGAPIDGGLSILLALGAGYGGFKLYKKKNESQPGSEEPEK
jgi:hypothetical protein